MIYIALDVDLNLLADALSRIYIFETEHLHNYLYISDTHTHTHKYPVSMHLHNRKISRYNVSVYLNVTLCTALFLFLS